MKIYDKNSSVGELERIGLTDDDIEKIVDGKVKYMCDEEIDALGEDVSNDEEENNNKVIDIGTYII